MTPVDLSSAERMPKPIPTPPPSILSQFVSDRLSTSPSAVSSMKLRKHEIGSPRLERPKLRMGVE